MIARCGRAGIVRWLLAVALVGGAGSATAVPADLTFGEARAIAPDASCFTGSPLLEAAGIPRDGALVLDPIPPGARGAEYDVLDIGDVSLVAGPWTYTPGLPETLTGTHVLGSLNAFLGAHEDEYDFVALYVTETSLGPFWSGLANDIEGIGQPIYDTATPIGFPDLEGYLYLDSVHDYADDVRKSIFFGQELGHRWAAYVDRSGGGRDMRGRDETHWSFYLSTSNSPMEGNAWQEGPPGRFATDHMADIGYSPLDLYLMGLRPPDEVPDWFLIENPQVVSNPSDWPTDSDSPPYFAVRATDPQGAPSRGPIVVEGDRVDITLADVLAEHGPREPDWTTAPRRVRAAVVLMMPASAPVTFDDYLATEELNDELEDLWARLVDDEAELELSLGRSGVHAIDLLSLGDAPTWESTFDPTTTTGVTPAACASSVGSASRAPLWLMLLVASAGRRRIRRRPPRRRAAPDGTLSVDRGPSP